MKVKSIWAGILLISFAVCTAAIATPVSLNFESLQHGEAIGTQFQSSHGVVFSGVNNKSGTTDGLGNHPDLLIGFDTQETGTADPDLEGPPWTLGNLAPSVVLGKVVIIAENDFGLTVPPVGIVTNPDDEAAGGQITIDFLGAPITSFGFHAAVDIEGPMIGDDNGYSVEFWSGAVQLAEVGFDEFVDNGSQYYDSTVVFGDHSANKIDTITIAELGIFAFNKVVVNFGESGALDNLVWTTQEVSLPIPEPLTFISIGLGLIGLVRRSYKKKQ